MLESLHVRPTICKEIRSGPFGAWVDPFIAALAKRGHAASVQRRDVRAVALFGVWMARHHITVAMIDEAVSPVLPGHRRWQSASRPSSPW